MSSEVLTVGKGNGGILMKQYEYLFKTTFANQKDLFRITADYLVENGYVTTEFGLALEKREKDYPTGLPSIPPVVIPHTDGTYVKKDTVLCVFNHEPLKFDEMGGFSNNPIYTQVIFILAIKAGEKHLEQLQHLIEKIQEGKLVEGILNSHSESEFKHVITTYLSV